MENNIRLLMVEDNPDDAGLILRNLERANFRLDARVVTTEKALIDELDTFRPDVILSDHGLQAFSSNQALQISRTKLPFVPFILVTGTASDEFAASIIKAGADDYLLKDNLRRLPTAILQAVEKKNAELQKEFDQSNLKALINNTHDLMWSVDRNFRLITSNNAFDEMAERTSGQSIVQGTDVLIEGFGQVQLARFKTLYERAFAGEMFTEIEYTALPSETWLEISFYPIRRGDVIVGTACYAHDITNLEKSKAKLAASEQRFRTLIENSSDAISLVNEKAEVIFFSKAAERMTGYSYQERKDTPGSKFMHPDDFEKSRARFEEVVVNPGKSFPFQVRQFKKDGSLMWVEGVVTNLLHDKNVNGILSNYHDISERKDAQDHLNRTLLRFEQAEQIARLGHWEIDYATQKTIWSDQTFRIYGLEPGSVEPSRDLFLQHVHPEDREMVRSVTEKGMETLVPFSYYHRIVQKGGRVRKLFSVRQSEFDKSGKPIGLYGVSLDITDASEKEEKLEQVNKELETFIYKAYHDLRSPIATILGTINVANKEVTEKLSLEYFAMIEQTAQKQSKMLLSLMKVMSIKNRVLIPESFEMDDLLRDVMQSLKTAVGFERIAFIIDNRLDKPITADRALMFDVIFHLTENSIQYADPRRPDCKIKIAVDEDHHGNIFLEVEDNGMGISEEVREKVFDMFYRGNYLSKGSGLGLYLVKNSVERLRGTIELICEGRTGCLFKVKLPADQAGQNPSG